MPNLKQKYRTEIAPVLMREFDFANVMEAPRVQKVVINIGMGEAMDNAKMVDAAVGDLSIISGQKPVVTKARISIANFKLREGRSIGTKVTLRSARMWDFLDRLINVALPRLRDFRGLPPTGFDGRGNWTLARSPPRRSRAGRGHRGAPAVRPDAPPRAGAASS